MLPHATSAERRTQPTDPPASPARLRVPSLERAHVAPRRVLIIVENLPCPFDRRVWQGARTLAGAGYAVSIICPKGKGYELGYEEIEGIAIYRHALPVEAAGAVGYALEYAWALAAEFALAFRVLFGRGFDAIHACNP